MPPRSNSRCSRVPEVVIVASAAISATTVFSRLSDGNAADEGGSSAPRAVSGCSHCGRSGFGTLASPVLDRGTTAFKRYFDVATRASPSQSDVALIASLASLGDDGEQGDRAVYALRAAAEWLASDRAGDHSADLSRILSDATVDPRVRVRINAERLLDELSRLFRA
jgi:hypothetical protein